MKRLQEGVRTPVSGQTVQGARVEPWGGVGWGRGWGKGRRRQALVLGGWSLAFNRKRARERRYEDAFAGSTKTVSLISLFGTHSRRQSNVY